MSSMSRLCVSSSISHLVFTLIEIAAVLLFGECFFTLLN